jgi:hypothetical protein
MGVDLLCKFGGGTIVGMVVKGSSKVTVGPSGSVVGIGNGIVSIATEFANLANALQPIIGSKKMSAVYILPSIVISLPYVFSCSVILQRPTGKPLFQSFWGVSILKSLTMLLLFRTPKSGSLFHFQCLCWI